MSLNLEYPLNIISLPHIFYVHYAKLVFSLKIEHKNKQVLLAFHIKEFVVTIIEKITLVNVQTNCKACISIN